MSRYEFNKDHKVATAFSVPRDKNLTNYSFTKKEADIIMRDPKFYAETYDYIPNGVIYNTEVQKLSDFIKSGDIRGFLSSMVLIESIPAACEKPDLRKFLSSTISNAIARMVNGSDDSPAITKLLIENCVQTYGIKLSEGEKNSLKCF